MTRQTLPGFVTLVFALIACTPPRVQSPNVAETPSTTAQEVTPSTSEGEPATREPTAPTEVVAKSKSTLRVPSGFTLPPYSVGMSQELVDKMSRERSTATPEMKNHTSNKGPDGTPTYLNRLILESSPYLRQHAYNPVNWFPFGEEAFDLAKTLNRPVLLSVGYTTCHWCHVMARESFDDPKIAAYLNENYISVKVDREERPDVDRVYMKVVTMQSGRGGWPMTVILTPEKTPLVGGAVALFRW